MKKYNLIVCGGTFDLFHSGHKEFLDYALSNSEKVILGITSNEYITTYKKNSKVEDFESRKKSVENFLESKDLSKKVEIKSINHGHEPLLEVEYTPQAILVTPNTLNSAEEINKKRKEKGLFQLIIEKIELKKAEDNQEISSTRIRNGEIDREGKLFIRKDWLGNDLLLPEELRVELKKPFGELINKVPDEILGVGFVTIGDVTTKSFIENNIIIFLSIVDLHVKRKKTFSDLNELGFDESIEKLEIDNPAATISYQLIKAVRKAFESKNRKVILINGEDDLAVLVVLLVAPLGYVLFYGQPDEGIVKVEVTEKKKEIAYDIVSRFKVKS